MFTYPSFDAKRFDLNLLFKNIIRNANFRSFLTESTHLTHLYKPERIHYPFPH